MSSPLGIRPAVWGIAAVLASAAGVGFVWAPSEVTRAPSVARGSIAALDAGLPSRPGPGQVSAAPAPPLPTIAAPSAKLDPAPAGDAPRAVDRPGAVDGDPTSANAVDPGVAHELRLLEFAAVRAAERRGLAVATASGAAESGRASVESTDAAPLLEAQLRSSLSSELIVEYLVRLRRLPEVLPDGTPSAPVREIARSISRRSVEGASPAGRLRLLQLALAALD